MKARISRNSWKYKEPFRITGRTFVHADTVVIELEDGDFVGRGEGLGVFYRHEGADEVHATLLGLGDVLSDVTRDSAQALLPAGGARNALDCALWDLEAKRAGKRVWELAGLGSVRPLQTTYTLGVGDPASMANSAKAAAAMSILKVKLNGDGGDGDRLEAIRRARPDATVTVDANQAWDMPQLDALIPLLLKVGVSLIEQPLPADADGELQDYTSPIPLCADESCQTVESLPSVIGKYSHINIKLDKTGGLTEALRLARIAKSAGLKLMVGGMGGTSLSMAPAFVVGQLCEVVDLDGPLLLEADRPNAIAFDGDKVPAPESALWG